MCDGPESVAVVEAKTALDKLATVDQLDSRATTLADRVGVADARLLAFVVNTPDDYTEQERKVMIMFIDQAIEKAVKSTHEEIKYMRTWNDTEVQS